MGAKGRLLLFVLTFASAVGFDSAFAQSWVMTSAPITNWSSVAMSSDGNLVVATCRYAIYMSTNAGATWFQANPYYVNWSSVACSADGTKLVAAGPHYLGSGDIWVSTNTGVDWFWAGPITNTWSDIAFSANGSNLVAVTGWGYSYWSYNVGRIYTSTNGGQNWTNPFSFPFAPNPSGRFTSVATSADGTRSMATSLTRVYSSQDSGMTWMPINGTDVLPSGHEWSDIAGSSDGSKWITVSYGGEIYLSSDYGINWSAANGPVRSWQAVASSSDASRLVAAATNSPIFLSTNSGGDWSETASLNLNWSSVASSSDGSHLVATVDGGGIYTWQTTPRPKLNISPSSNELLVSWIVPSMPFVLQENADLKTADWVDVPTQPTLNLSNLHHEVSVPLPGTNRFYRLKSL